MKKMICLFALVSLVVSSSALAGTKSGLNSFNFGNAQAGAKGTYSVAVENRNAYSSVSETITGDVMLLGKKTKGVEFNVAVENSNGKKRASYALSLAGYTVDTGAKSVSYAWNKPVNRTLFSASAVVMAGPVPVTVSGSVGGGASMGYKLSLGTTEVALSGGASAWANGSASAGIGVPLLTLSLQADLTLAKTSLSGTLQATPTTMTGNVGLQFDPLKIDFAVVLKSMRVEWYRYDIAQYSATRRNVSLLRL
jgi:hypothetical protein